MPHTLRLLLLLGALLAGSAHAAHDFDAWVLRVDITLPNGTRDSGSGVLIAPDRVLTSCHVVARARRIDVVRDGASWPANADAGDTFRDLCVLKLARAAGTPVPIAGGAPTVGETVYAVGYSGGSYRVSRGQIKGLFTCACDGGKVIQTSAPFDPGASGGGLFNAAGELVGVLTFKSSYGGIFHFAVPVGWLKALDTLPASPVPDQRPFWERPAAASGYFLAACDLSAKKKWRELAQLSREWVREDPYNPQSWMALGRAELGLGRQREAIGHFQRVLALDPMHAEAQWELQQLELELGVPLTD